MSRRRLSTVTVGHRWLPATAVLASLLGCGTEQSATPGFTVRDSAGITIAESFEPAWGEGEGWQLSAEPNLDIGVVEGDPQYQLFDVRDAARTSDGDILVANGGPQEIRLYDPNGQFLTAIGREGEGPGEFTRLVEVQARTGDTVTAVEARPHTLSTFSSGELVWSERLHLEGAAVAPISSNDGSVVAAALSGQDLVAFMEDPASVGGFHRASTTLIRFGPSGRLQDTVGIFPGQEWAAFLRPDGRRDTQPPVYGRDLEWTAHDRDVYVGIGESYEIAVYGENGTLERLIRRPSFNVEITPADRDSLTAALDMAMARQEDPEARLRIEGAQASIPLAEGRRPYGEFLVDSEGHLWVKAYNIGSQVKGLWDVFGPEGRWLGEMTVPDGFQLFEVGEDYVLGLATDELDVEHVRIYGLTR